MAKSKIVPMKNNSGVYALINTCNQKIYIGSSKELEVRRNKHFWQLKNNRHGNNHLQHSFNKYGESSFEFKILKLCKESELIKQEQIFINKYNSTNQECGYNKSLNAGKITMTDEIRLKIGLGNKGKKVSIETREKISKAGMGNKYNLGRRGFKHSKESLEKMSNIHKGNTNRLGMKTSESVKKKLSEANLKYKHFYTEWKELFLKGIKIYRISVMYNVSSHTVDRFIKKEVLGNA